MAPEFFFLSSIVISKGPNTQKKKFKSLTPLHNTNTIQETQSVKFPNSYHEREFSRQSAFSKAVPIF